LAQLDDRVKERTVGWVTENGESGEDETSKQ